MADGVKVVSETQDAEITQHPRESLSGPAGLAPATEARLKRTRSVAVEYYLSDGGSTLHPSLPRRGRAAALAADFRTLADDPRMLQSWIRDINGNAPLANVLIGSYTIARGDTAHVTISTTLVCVQFADVVEGALVVDADLLAAGLP